MAEEGCGIGMTRKAGRHSSGKKDRKLGRADPSSRGEREGLRGNLFEK